MTFSVEKPPMTGDTNKKAWRLLKSLMPALETCFAPLEEEESESKERGSRGVLRGCQKGRRQQNRSCAGVGRGGENP